MSQTRPRPKVGLLALTLELYESMVPGLRESRERWVREDVLPILGKFAEVAFPGAVYRREDIEAAVSRFEADGAEALLVLLLTYSPSQLALPALTRTTLPIMIWNTQELFSVDEGFTGDEMVKNHGVHGTQDLANVLLRAGVPFSYVTSHTRDARGMNEVADFCCAAAAVHRLRRARLGLLGYPFPGMGDSAVDTTHMVATLGCEWKALSVGDYVQRSEHAPTSAVSELVAVYRDTYDISADVAESDLEATARVELALRGMIADQGLDGITYQFMAFGEDERTLTVPFVAASRLMADGIGFGGEGDLIAVAGTSFLNWLNPPASFAEIFTIDFGGNALFMSHMGEANVAMARRDRKVAMVARATPITATGAGQLVLSIALEPGPATLYALTTVAGSRWRLIASQMTIPEFGPLPDMVAPHFKLSPTGDVREFLTEYARAGGPHHLAVCFGDARSRLKAAAQLLNADYCEI
jgi:L-arabinose isomerase